MLFLHAVPSNCPSFAVSKVLLGWGAGCGCRGAGVRGFDQSRITLSEHAATQEYSWLYQPANTLSQSSFLFFQNISHCSLYHQSKLIFEVNIDSWASSGGRSMDCAQFPGYSIAGTDDPTIGLAYLASHWYHFIGYLSFKLTFKHKFHYVVET